MLHRATVAAAIALALPVAACRQAEKAAPDSPHPSPPPSSQAHVAKIADLGIFERSAMVITYDESGNRLSSATGTLLQNHYVVTAAHAVHGAAAIRVWTHIHTGKGYIGRAREASVECTVPTHDLAFLHCEEPLPELGSDWTPLAGYAPRRGEFVYVHDYAAIFEGRARTLEGFIQKGQAYGPNQINVSGRPGSSGAGVYVRRNGRYELAGVVIARTDYPRSEVQVFRPSPNDIVINVYSLRGWSVTDISPVDAVRWLRERARNNSH